MTSENSGCDAPPPAPVVRESIHREVTSLLELALTGDLTKDRTATERRAVRSLGALVRLQEHHAVDGRGRCSICRAAPHLWWPWPRRIVCTVHSVLASFVYQPDRCPQPVTAESVEPAECAS
jgi:hypothetical protein